MNAKIETVQEAWEMYHAAVLASAKKKSQIIEEGRWENYITPILGNMSIEQLTNLDYLKVRRNVESQERSPQTVYHCLSLLRRVLKRVEEWGGRSDLPSFRNVFPKFDNRRQRFLSVEEVNQILKYLEPSENWYNIATVALHTGLRRGEIFNLSFSHINFSEKLLTVVDTKSGKNRTIPLNETAFNVLYKLKQISRSSGEPIFKNIAPKTFSLAVKASGLNDGVSDSRQKIVFHSLRHTFASWLVQAGTDLMVINQLLGHSSLHVTMRYAHLAPRQAQHAVCLIEQRFESREE